MVLGRCSTVAAWGWRLFREPSQPRDMQHHAVLCGRDARLFDALVRDLRLRLFQGRVQAQPMARMANLRQGLAPRFSASLFGLGCGVLIAGVLAASELGRSFRQLARDGGVAHTAVPAVPPPDEGAPRLPLTAAGAATLGAGLGLASANRKHFWLVSHPSERHGEIDIWVAAATWGREEKFADEFAAFLQRAARLEATLRHTTLVTAWRAPDPEAGIAEADATFERRGTGAAARP